MDASDIPTKIQLPFAAGAGGSYIRAVPVASQIGIQDGAASYTDGFPPLNFTDPAFGGVDPFGADMNGVLNAISALAMWFSAGGPIPWDSAFSTAIGGYPRGAIVQSVTTFGTLWVCTVDDNLSNPDTGGAGWLTFLSFIGAAAVGGGGGGGTGTGIGYSQTWQDVTTSRHVGVTYTNTTGKPIYVTAEVDYAGAYIVIDGANVFTGENTVNAIIPPGATYYVGSIGGSATAISWSELR